MEPTDEYGYRLYGFGQPLERERISLLGGIFDLFSRRRISDLGLAAGWRCLDVGAGPGTVAAWVAEGVGPTGEVTALDRDVRLLRQMRFPGVRIWEADVDTAAAEGLPTPGFDLVHARLTICHLPERERVLERLASWLNPGGWLLVSDAINTMQSGSPDPDVRRVAQAYDRAISGTLGSDLNYARAYPSPLRALGLASVDAAADVPMIRGEGPSGRFWQLTFTAMRQEIISTGLIDEAGFARAMTHLTTPGTCELAYTLVSAWGQYPMGSGF
ncbi:class I SAM-dependent methyltransferase [Streptomyces sp. BE147]|uniref:class I SAM-dependent methyltransferase n=1 Tax=Streptomyces sp. BE147 TaxID=3002524 RepID=UPI002E764AD9|nr:class I SAM-dependent methyltransferase [Streptomyces sp. BE147]MEE1737865.1 class I SAM-dependent methyltransferase [Streptomyces sp. BE147]